MQKQIPPKPKCSQNKALKSFCCMTQKCSKKPFLCGDLDCKCYKNHQTCNIKNWGLLTQRLSNDKLVEVSNQLDQLRCSYQKNLQQIQKVKQKIEKIKKIQVSDIQKKFQDKIKEGNYEQMDGNFLYQVEIQSKKKYEVTFNMFEDFKNYLKQKNQKKLNNLQEVFTITKNDITKIDKHQQKIQFAQPNKKQVKQKIYQNNKILYGVIFLIFLIIIGFYFNDLNNQLELNQKEIIQLKERNNKLMIQSDKLKETIIEPKQKNKMLMIKDFENLISKKKIGIQSHELKINNLKSLIIKSQIQKQQLIKQVKKPFLEQINNLQIISLENLKKTNWQLSVYQYFQFFNKLEKDLKAIYMKFIEKIQTSDFRIIALEKYGFFNKTNKTIKSMDLCYRASENNFQVSKFHQKCDGKQHTITILKTQFGNVIGGYTPLPWDKNKHKDTFGNYQADNSIQSFIFSLTTKHKLTIIQGKQHRADKAIHHYSNWGPVFGGGDDMVIKDKANQNRDSYGRPGHTYNNNNQYVYDTQQSYKKWSGQSSGQCFKILQWQVYAIVFQ